MSSDPSALHSSPPGTPGLDALRPHLSAAAWEFLRQRPDVAQSCLQSPEILLRIKYIYDQVAAGLPPPTPEAAVAHARQQLRLLSGPAAPLDVPPAIMPSAAPNDVIPPNLPNLQPAPTAPPALPRPWTAPFEFSLLPLEVIIQILTFCDSTTLVRAELACRVFRSKRPVNDTTAVNGANNVEKMTVGEEAAKIQCNRLGVNILSSWNASTDKSWKRELHTATRKMDDVWITGGGLLEGHMSYFQGGVTSVCVSPDGEHILTGSADGTAKIWELRTGSLVRSLEKHLHTGEVSSVCVCKNGQFAITASDDRTACFWDLRSGNLVRTVEHHAGVTSVCANIDELQVVTGTQDNSIYVWDQMTGANLKRLVGYQGTEHTDAVTCVSVSPDGEHCISGSRDKTAKIWGLRDGILMRTLVGHNDHVTSVCTTPDSKYVLTASKDGSTGVWELDTGTLVRTLTGHTSGVQAICVSPNGMKALTGSEDSTAIVWCMQTGQALRTLEGHTNSVNSVCWTPDGNYAVTGSADGTARVWVIGTD